MASTGTQEPIPEVVHACAHCGNKTPVQYRASVFLQAFHCDLCNRISQGVQLAPRPASGFSNSPHDRELIELFSRQLALSSSPSSGSTSSRASDAGPAHATANAQRNQSHDSCMTDATSHRSSIATSSIATATPRRNIYYPSAPYIHSPMTSAAVTATAGMHGAEPYMVSGYAALALMQADSRTPPNEQNSRSTEDVDVEMG